ncbi:hypothetical protein [Erysipelothrix anatis]|uniref:hypothetical protein n=1 Tax=Erysipelothrix anatis TaxID=2683713 RepID=UPI00135A5557|nr:hypothetical protein [Erysipelothrix anatis]
MTNRVFKRTPINIIKNLLYTLFTPVFIYIAAYFLLQFTGLEAKMQEMIAIGLSALIFLWMLKMLVVDEKVVVTVDDTGLTYKSGSKESRYNFENCQFGYKTVSSQGSTDTINLYVYQGDQEIMLNCEPLGPRQFDELFNILKGHTVKDEPQRLN